MSWWWDEFDGRETYNQLPRNLNSFMNSMERAANQSTQHRSINHFNWFVVGFGFSWTADWIWWVMVGGGCPPAAWKTNKPNSTQPMEQSTLFIFSINQLFSLLINGVNFLSFKKKGGSH